MEDIYGKRIRHKCFGGENKAVPHSKRLFCPKTENITGVSKSHINNIESANSHASAEVLVRIANALEISVDILLCDSLNRKTSQGARMTEFTQMLEECTEKETKIIVDTVKALRESLKQADLK